MDTPPQQPAAGTSPGPPRLVIISGPIAAGKSTVAQQLTTRLRTTGTSVALVDLDTIAEMALPTLPTWDWAHSIHARMVGLWLATAIDVVVDEGTSTLAEVRQVLEQCPPGTTVLHVVLTADFEASLRRAEAEESRGLSKERDFLRQQHDRFARELPHLPCDLRLHVEGRTPAELAEEIRSAMSSRGAHRSS